MKLNLGCSDDLRDGWLNVDQNAAAFGLHPAHFTSDGAGRIGAFGPAAAGEPGSFRIQIADLRERWPWPDSSVDQIFAHDVFEHIDNDQFRGNRGKIWVMNEAWRVLREGGLLDLWVPSVCGIGAFCDPTHVSFWTPDDKYYFCEAWNNQQGERGRLGPAYGIAARFSIREWTHEMYGEAPWHRWKIKAKLVAVK